MPTRIISPSWTPIDELLADVGLQTLQHEIITYINHNYYEEKRHILNNEPFSHDGHNHNQIYCCQARPAPRLLKLNFEIVKRSCGLLT